MRFHVFHWVGLVEVTNHAIFVTVRVHRYVVVTSQPFGTNVRQTGLGRSLDTRATIVALHVLHGM